MPINKDDKVVDSIYSDYLELRTKYALMFDDELMFLDKLKKMCQDPRVIKAIEKEQERLINELRK